MTEKSYVSMEQRICLVCGTKFSTNGILLDLRLRDRFEMFTVTGWGLCPQHQALCDAGFIALVEFDPEDNGLPSHGEFKLNEVHRTGKLAHLKREAFNRIFNSSIDDTLPCVFVEPGVIDKLNSLAEKAKSS